MFGRYLRHIGGDLGLLSKKDLLLKLDSVKQFSLLFLLHHSTLLGIGEDNGGDDDFVERDIFS
jgi:hypothetical protein